MIIHDKLVQKVVIWDATPVHIQNQRPWYLDKMYRGTRPVPVQDSSPDSVLPITYKNFDVKLKSVTPTPTLTSN